VPENDESKEAAPSKHSKKKKSVKVSGGKRLKKGKGEKNLGRSRFIEEEAEQASDISESDNDDEREIGGHDGQYYKPEDLARKNDQRGTLANIERKAIQGEFDEESEDERVHDQDQDMEEEGQDAL
jgi:hypothetical protein